MNISPPRDPFAYFNPNQSFIWKSATPSFGYGEISNYYDDVVLEYPIYFSDLPNTPGEPYIPSYTYIPIRSHDPAMDKIIKHIGNIQSIIESNFDSCMVYSQSCEAMAPETRFHATHSCCGFTAPVFSVFLHEYKKFYNKNKNMNMTYSEQTEIQEKAVIFYHHITGYGKKYEETSWNSRCDGWEGALYENVNLVTFYGQPFEGEDGYMKCKTYHHFVVYINPKNTDYSIIIDAWAGDKGGNRGKWIRVMYTEHLVIVLNAIQSTDNMKILNMLINQYFVVPNNPENTELDLITEKIFIGNISLNNSDDNLNKLYIINNRNYAPKSSSGLGKRKRSRKMKAVAIKFKITKKSTKKLLQKINKSLRM